MDPPVLSIATFWTWKVPTLFAMKLLVILSCEIVKPDVVKFLALNVSA